MYHMSVTEIALIDGVYFLFRLKQVEAAWEKCQISVISLFTHSFASLAFDSTYRQCLSRSRLWLHHSAGGYF
jgi:hypothetical protein